MYTVVLANERTDSWVLSYLSKLQDRVNILYAGTGNVDNVNTSAWGSENHMHAKSKAAVRMAIKSIDEEQKPNLVTTEKLFDSINKLNNPDLIYVLDDYTKRYARYIALNKRDCKVIVHSDDKVYIRELNQENEWMLDFDIKDNTHSHEHNAMVSVLIFMILNKLIHNERLIFKRFNIDYENLTLNGTMG